MAQYNFKMALCEGRHEIKGAVDGSIFKGEVDPLAVDRLENMAFNSLLEQMPQSRYIRICKF